MNKYIVYKHTFPNNKVYIGITSCIKPNGRWRNGKGYETQYVYRAIKKYGWNNIKHEILYDNLFKEQAEEKEILLIKLYKSNDRKYGYNIENGGHLNTMTEEIKTKISKALKGKKYKKRRNHTEEEKKKISDTLKGRISPMKNKHWSIEQRSSVGTSIICIDTGEIFYSIREAERKTGLSHANISRCLKGIYKQTGGLHFEYERK